MSKRGWMTMFLLLAGAASPTIVRAQDGPPDFAEMRQRMEERMKQTLGATDDEWKVLKPKIDAIRNLQRDAYPRPMPMFMGGPPGGPGGPPDGGGPGGPPDGGGPGGPDGGGPPRAFLLDGGPDQKPSAVQQKLRDLQEAVNNKQTTPDDLKAKAQALREARAQAKSDLTKAEDDLRQLVTPRQEAALLSLGVLE